MAVELQQAGAFGIRNVPAQDMQRLLGIFCPNYLLPYAREVISDLLTKGGFPPFLLPPVNFERCSSRPRRLAPSRLSRKRLRHR